MHDRLISPAVDGTIIHEVWNGASKSHINRRMVYLRRGISHRIGYLWDLNVGRDFHIEAEQPP